jgi:hypothetical protein
MQALSNQHSPVYADKHEPEGSLATTRNRDILSVNDSRAWGFPLGLLCAAVLPPVCWEICVRLPLDSTRSAPYRYSRIATASARRVVGVVEIKENNFREIRPVTCSRGPLSGLRCFRGSSQRSSNARVMTKALRVAGAGDRYLGQEVGGKMIQHVIGGSDAFGGDDTGTACNKSRRAAEP